MPRPTLPAIAALAAAMLTMPATAATSDQTVRCLMAANIFSKVEPDAAKKQAAVSALFFYLGRLDPAQPQAQLKAQLVAQGKSLNQQNLGPTMNACVQQIGAEQKVMQTISQQLGPVQMKKAP